MIFSFHEVARRRGAGGRKGCAPALAFVVSHHDEQFQREAQRFIAPEIETEGSLLNG